jgi:hypothetical protein
MVPTPTINIYRITHVRNVPHILKYGITHKNSDNANPCYLNIGDQSLIDTRSHRSLQINNGDLLNSNTASINLGDFIPFYFGVRMPMLYVIQNGGNFVANPTSAEDIVYLVCSLDSIIESGNIFYFSDGHATDNFSTFYDKTKMDELRTIIDWDAVKAQFWSGQENLNVKRKKQAECLIAGDVLPHNLIGFGCFNQKAKDILVNIGVSNDKIKIIPAAYY